MISSYDGKYNAKIKMRKNLEIVLNAKQKLHKSYGMYSYMPCPFTGRKMFCTSQSFLSQPKNLTAFSATSKTFGTAQKPILLNENHLFVWHKIFVTATICK